MDGLRCWADRCLSFALQGEKFDQILYFLRLERFAKGRHPTTSSHDLMFNLWPLLPLADCAQIRTELASTSVHSVAVLATSFVKESSPIHLVSMFLSTRGQYKALLWEILVDQHHPDQEYGENADGRPSQKRLRQGHR